MSDLRALLLTDVVDSTKLTKQFGDEAMGELSAGTTAPPATSFRHRRPRDRQDRRHPAAVRAAVDAVRYALAYHAGAGALGDP